jgi:hypothetical protein
VPSTEKSGEFVNFRAILLTRCQLEFEKDKDAEDKIEKLRAAMKEETDVSQKIKYHIFVSASWFLRNFSYKRLHCKFTSSIVSSM